MIELVRRFKQKSVCIFVLQYYNWLRPAKIAFVIFFNLHQVEKILINGTFGMQFFSGLNQSNFRESRDGLLLKWKIFI